MSKPISKPVVLAKEVEAPLTQKIRRERKQKLAADRPWYASALDDDDSSSRATEGASSYSFWTSRAAIGAYTFVTLSLLSGDVRLLHGVTVVLVAQMVWIVRRWVIFLSELAMLQECIDVSRGYLKLIRRHCMAFVDQEKVHPFRKVTAGLVLHQRNLQFYVLTQYIYRRNRIMKKKAHAETEQSKRHLFASG